MAVESTKVAQVANDTDEAPRTQAPSPSADSSLTRLGGTTPALALGHLLEHDHSDVSVGTAGRTQHLNYNEVYAEVFTVRDEVRGQIIKCHKKLKLPPVAEIAQGPDWKEVEASVKEACDEIQQQSLASEAVTGVASNLRRAFNFLCRHAGAGETFVSVIPTDQFGFASVLCGGLKAIFSALKNTHEYREKVYQALEDLPYIICDHSVPLDDHIDDEELHRRAAGLHIAVFKVIKRILRWWLSSSFVLALKTVTNPSKLLSDLKEDLAEVKVKASRFERRALIITQSLQRQSWQLQRWSALDSERKNREVQALRNDVKSLKEMICRSDSLDRLGAPPKTITSGPGAESSNQLTKQIKPQRRQPDANVDTALAKFRYEKNLVLNDCQALLKLMSPQHSSVVDHDRILAIESSFRIQAWLIIDEPSLLLIDGRAESRRDTEVSVFVARIVHRLHCWQAEVSETDEESPVILPLAFFCSQHRDQRDAHSNPTELAMSLLLQLIDQYRHGYKPSLLQKVKERLDPTKMSSICSTLEELIKKLQSKVVLILIVDGLVHFTQDEAQTQQTRELISSLIAIYRGRPAVTLKFLFSNPTRPDFVEHLFFDKEMLQLPRSVTSAQSPNNMHWKKPVEFRSRTDRDARHR